MDSRLVFSKRINRLFYVQSVRCEIPPLSKLCGFGKTKILDIISQKMEWSTKIKRKFWDDGKSIAMPPEKGYD